MKKLLAFALGAAFSAGAYANTATYLPPGPIYVKLNGLEQIATGGATTYQGTNEINWGVFTVSSMDSGYVRAGQDHTVVSDSTAVGSTFFVNGQAGQITGMFYGIEAGTPNAGDPFPATGGFVDLYWRDLSTMAATDNAAATPGVRCGVSCAHGYTDGTFLVRLKFDSGMDLVDAGNDIVGSVDPSSNPSGFSGYANAFASVDTSLKGLWTDQLDSNWFNTWTGQRDLRFKNSYDANADWNGGPGILGAQIDDPGQAVALPEPGALSLMGLALAGMGLVLRRRQKR